MVIGAAQMDGASCGFRSGPMLRQETHPLARQVGVPYIVVFLNKCDMVEDKGDDLVEEEIRDLLKKYNSRRHYPIIAVQL